MEIEWEPVKRTYSNGWDFGEADDQCKTQTTAGGEGIRYGRIRRILDRVHHEDVEDERFWIPGSEVLSWTPGTVDTLTGWDCLSFLQTKGRERKELLVERYERKRALLLVIAYLREERVRASQLAFHGAPAATLS